jgi:hypothetical protein
MFEIYKICIACLVELVDTLALGASAFGCQGSSPWAGTTSRDGEIGRHAGLKIQYQQ